MSDVGRVAGFVVALAAAFGIGAGVGALVGPLDVGGDDRPAHVEVTDDGEH